jgi:2-polyprenyl-6-methoxyphenol hydroxylase-like FAD-dependent oxidoreductase
LVQVIDVHTTVSATDTDKLTGMGGLATSLALAKQGFKQIDVYESSSNLGFVGAGIQLAPNMARILDRMGVWKDIEAEAVDLKETSIRRSCCPKHKFRTN